MAGDKVIGMNPGGGIRQPFGHVKFTIAHHSSSMPDGSYGGVPGGFLLALADGRVYFACDTALFLDMKLIGSGGTRPGRAADRRLVHDGPGGFDRRDQPAQAEARRAVPLQHLAAHRAGRGHVGRACAFPHGGGTHRAEAGRENPALLSGYRKYPLAVIMVARLSAIQRLLRGNLMRISIKIGGIVLAALAVVASLFAAAGARAQEPLRWKFETGQKLNYNMVQDMTIGVAGGPFGEQNMTIHQVMNMMWNVVDAKEGGDAVIRQKFDRVQTKMTMPPVGVIEYDSASDQAARGPGGDAGSVYKALTEAEFELTMTPRGEIKDVKDSGKTDRGFESQSKRRRIGRSGHSRWLQENDVSERLSVAGECTASRRAIGHQGRIECPGWRQANRRNHLSLRWHEGRRRREHVPYFSPP